MSAALLLSPSPLSAHTHTHSPYPACLWHAGAVPQLVTAWQGISRAECAKAAEAADAAHAAAFNAAAEDEAALYESHQAAVATAVAAFRERAMGDAELLSEHEGRLRAGAEERYVTARRRLAASGERLAGELLAAEDGRLRELMSRPDASIDAVEVELRRCDIACCKGVLVLPPHLPVAWPVAHCYSLPAQLPTHMYIHMLHNIPSSAGFWMNTTCVCQPVLPSTNAQQSSS